jgi:NAD-dependent deacetylase
MTGDALDRLAARVRSATAIAVMTGAGISAESGVPTFRGKDGLWRNYNATDLATPDAFARDPGLVWQWYRWRRSLVGRAEPNAGHLSLARIQRLGRAFTLITQNVDGLHQRAGSTGVIELHGNIWRARCARECGFVADETDSETTGHAESERGTLPSCSCGALLRPDVVWFGEALDPLQLDLAVQAARRCDVFVVVGTSSLVYPAAGLPDVAGSAGALVAEINLDDTPLTSRAGLVIRGRAAEVLPALEARL